MRFFSRFSNYSTPIKQATMRKVPGSENDFEPVPGVVARFKSGMYNTKDNPFVPEEEQLAAFRRLPEYGYGRDVWAEIDRPATVSAEEELQRLRSLEAEYKRVLSENAAPSDKPTMAILRAKAKSLGIHAEKTWREDDYLRAISAAEAEKTPA